MENQLVKNQHYVPQRYLRYFSNVSRKKNKDIHRFSVFDKKKVEIRENQNIEDLASERFFYDVDFELIKSEAEEEGVEVGQEYIDLIKEVDKQELEHTFATKVETTMFDPIAQIVTSYTMTQKSAYPNIYVIPEDKRATVAYYITLQYLRTKEFREKMVQVYERGGKLLMKKLLKGKVDNDFLNDVNLRLKESRINLFHNEVLLDIKKIEEIALILLGHIWFIAVNETDTQFYTSDNPLVLNGYLAEHGLKSKGVEIIFPITPKLALIMREREYFDRDLLLYNRFLEVNEEYVKYCNQLQVLQSYRYVFSKDNKFNIAEELLKQHPELSDLDRDRYIMG
jgi:hypothetical protein